MARVKLGDVAREYKATCGDQKEGLRVVGLEHLIPQQIILTLWDEGKENTFTKMFKKGQVLFGRRRAYLKKAAVAPFDGICSGDITVIEAIPGKILPELLPFIIQNDTLFDFAVERSAGSLSPRVKWEHLKNFEFELPELDRQKELADILWASERAKTAYRELISNTDELVKSQFIEMFGDITNGEYRWEARAFDDVIADNTRFGTKIPTDDYLTNGTYPIIDQGQSFISGYVNSNEGLYTNCPAIIFGDHTRCFKYIDFPFFLGADGVKLLKLKTTDVNYRFMVSQLTLLPLANMGYNRHFRWLREFKLIIPPIALQDRYSSMVEQFDKSKSLYELTAQNQVMGGVRCA